MIRLLVHPNLSELSTDPYVVGARVMHREAFLAIAVPFVTESIPRARFEQMDGEWTFPLPPEVLPLVTSGIGKRTSDPDHYVVRDIWGHKCRRMKRTYALPAQECTAWVFTIGRYREEEAKNPYDPFLVFTEDELKDVTHVLVGIRIHAAAPRAIRQRRQNGDDLAWLTEWFLAGRRDLFSTTLMRSLLRQHAPGDEAYWWTFVQVSD